MPFPAVQGLVRRRAREAIQILDSAARPLQLHHLPQSASPGVPETLAGDVSERAEEVSMSGGAKAWFQAGLRKGSGPAGGCGAGLLSKPTGRPAALKMLGGGGGASGAV